MTLDRCFVAVTCTALVASAGTAHAGIVRGLVAGLLFGLAVAVAQCVRADIDGGGR